MTAVLIAILVAAILGGGYFAVGALASRSAQKSRTSKKELDELQELRRLKLLMLSMASKQATIGDPFAAIIVDEIQLIEDRLHGQGIT